MSDRREGLNARRARISMFRPEPKKTKEVLREISQDMKIPVNCWGYFPESATTKQLMSFQEEAQKKGFVVKISQPKQKTAKAA